jgi:hypothetical protein
LVVKRLYSSTFSLFVCETAGWSKKIGIRTGQLNNLHFIK